MNLSLKNLLILGVFIEIIILLAAWFLYPEMPDTFRYAARYSGRLSFIVFLYTFYLFASSCPQPIQENLPLKNFLTLFAVLHVIHFGYLSASVYLNELPLEIHKVIGGALAYLLIVIAPFKLAQTSFKFQIFYFYYVSFVMAMTYVARLKGELEGAAPYWFHYAGLATMVGCCILFGIWIFRGRRKAV